MGGGFGDGFAGRLRGHRRRRGEDETEFDLLIRGSDDAVRLGSVFGPVRRRQEILHATVGRLGDQVCSNQRCVMWILFANNNNTSAGLGMGVDPFRDRCQRNLHWLCRAIGPRAGLGQVLLVIVLGCGARACVYVMWWCDAVSGWAP